MEYVDQDQTKSWVIFPKPGEQYNHYKGGLYEVMTLANDDSGDVVVVYRSVIFGSYHTKPLGKWFEKVKTKDEFGNDAITVRFKKV